MIKQAVVTDETPSVESGRRGTVERDGESVCPDEIKRDQHTAKKLAKSAAFKPKQDEEGED